jgi:biotin carboxylase
MIGKLIVHDRDRASAIRRAQRALRETRIEGIGTNIDFLARVLGDPDFLANEFHTKWLEERLDHLLPAPVGQP